MDLVPVYGFGNNDVYTTYNTWVLPFLQWLSKTTAVALPLFSGRFFTPVPYKRPMKVVIGAPIKVPAVLEKENNPKYGDVRAVPSELIDEYLAKYIGELKALYDRHAYDFYGEKRELEIY